MHGIAWRANPPQHHCRSGRRPDQSRRLSGRVGVAQATPGVTRTRRRQQSRLYPRSTTLRRAERVARRQDGIDERADLLGAPFGRPVWHGTPVRTYVGAAAPKMAYRARMGRPRCRDLDTLPDGSSPHYRQRSRVRRSGRTSAATGRTSSSPTREAHDARKALVWRPVERRDERPPVSKLASSSGCDRNPRHHVDCVRSPGCRIAQLRREAVRCRKEESGDAPPGGRPS